MADYPDPFPTTEMQLEFERMQHELQQKVATEAQETIRERVRQDAETERVRLQEKTARKMDRDTLAVLLGAIALFVLIAVCAAAFWSNARTNALETTKIQAEKTKVATACVNAGGQWLENPYTKSFECRRGTVATP